MMLKFPIDDYLPENEKLSVNDFMIKAAAQTLREFPNLNPAEAGILAIGSAREVPVVENGELKVGRMKAMVSVDHRVSDGAEGARFMQALAKYLEAPVVMLV